MRISSNLTYSFNIKFIVSLTESLRHESPQVCLSVHPHFRSRIGLKAGIHILLNMEPKEQIKVTI